MGLSLSRHPSLLWVHLIWYPMATGNIFHRGWLKSTGIEQVSARGNASDLYSGNARFEPRPGHWLSVRGLMVLFTPSKCLNITSIRPRGFLSKSSPIHYKPSYHSTLSNLRHRQHRQTNNNDFHKYPTNDLVADTRSQTDEQKGGHGLHTRGSLFLRKNAYN